MGNEKITYKAVKIKLKNITNVQLLNVINEFVLKINKILQEGIFLLNNYVLYCLEKNIPVDIDTTLIRQSCFIIIDPKTKLGRIKKNFKKRIFQI